VLAFQQNTRFGPSNDPRYWQEVEAQSQQRLNVLAVQMQAMLKEAMDKKHQTSEQQQQPAMTQATPIQIHENFLTYLSSIVETFRSQQTEQPDNYEWCRKHGIPGVVFIEGYCAFLKENSLEQKGATKAWIANELSKIYQKFASTKLIPNDIQKNNPKCQIIEHGRLSYKDKYTYYVMNIHELEAILRRFYPVEFDKRSLVPGFCSWLCFRESN